MITFPYDQTYDPAAPVCRISLEVILGRDLLNRLRIILDGPHRVSQIFE